MQIASNWASDRHKSISVSAWDGSGLDNAVAGGVAAAQSHCTSWSASGQGNSADVEVYSVQNDALCRFGRLEVNRSGAIVSKQGLRSVHVKVLGAEEQVYAILAWNERLGDRQERPCKQTVCTFSSTLCLQRPLC